MRFVVALVLVAGLGITGPEAYADSWAARDRRGDVVATPLPPDDGTESDDCEGPPEHRARRDARRDIRRLAVDHGAEVVTVTLTMRRVAARDKGTSYTINLHTDRKAYELHVSPSAGGAPDVFLSYEPDYPEPEELEGCTFAYVTTGVPCERLDADIDDRSDQVSVTVPRVCLKSPRWVRVGARSNGFSGEYGDQDFEVLSDVWSRHGEESVGFLPPFGPRVRAGDR